MKNKRAFVLLISAVFVLICFVSILWNILIERSTPFRTVVSEASARIKANIQIFSLPAYSTFEEAKAAAEEETIKPIVDNGSFGIVDLDYFVVEEKAGWKIENTLQFCRGHDGITDSNGCYLLIARIVRDKWIICVAIYDNSLVCCNLDGEVVNLYSYSVDSITNVQQYALIMIPLDDKEHLLQIGQDHYLFQKNNCEIMKKSVTNSGNWAHKPGEGASALVSNSAQLNPIDLNWVSNGDGVDYISTPVYFAIKYTGSQPWVDNNTSY